MTTETGSKNLGLFTAVNAAHDWAATPCLTLELDDHEAEITPYGVAVGVATAATVALGLKILITKALTF